MNDLDLQKAWRERPVTEDAERDCEQSERVWQAVNLELTAEERAQVAEHAIHCAECSRSWRLAASLVRAPADSAISVEPASPWSYLLPAAAILLVAIGLSLWTASNPRHTQETEWRSSNQNEIRSLLEDRAPLPRDRFVLRWSSGPAGTIYDLEIGTPDLEVLDRATALEATEYQVAASRLADLQPGDVVAWRVIATSATGERVLSVTFFNTVR